MISANRKEVYRIYKIDENLNMEGKRLMLKVVIENGKNIVKDELIPRKMHAQAVVN